MLTGSATVRCDDPQLNVRLSYGPWVRQPLRVVLDTELRCRPDAKVFRGGDALVFAAIDAAASDDGAGAAKVERVPRGSDGGLDLGAVVERLAVLEINELLVECGAQLAGSFLAKRLVDEIVLYMAPRFMGDDAAPLARLHLGTGSAELAGKYEFSDVRRMGEDVRLLLTSRKD